MSYYDECCRQRLEDLIRWVAKARPGQTIAGDYVFHNARLRDIAKGSAATQRIVDWAKKEVESRK